MPEYSGAIPTHSVPTRHQVEAARHVAALLSPRGSHADEVRESYWRHATGGSLPPSDLVAGEQLLDACGLVIRQDGRLIPKPELSEILDGTPEDAAFAIAYRLVTANRGVVVGGSSDMGVESLFPDALERERFLVMVGQHHDEVLRRELGSIGEEVVVTTAREELNRLGRKDLAKEVRRLSLQSDQLGYDVSAPRVDGPSRLLEVKATLMDVASESDTVVCHLTRNEIRIGLQYPDQWALVVCGVIDVQSRTGAVVGWIAAVPIYEMLPVDGPRAAWEVAQVRIPRENLSPGLPRPSV